jgi:hypothetical protein
MVHSGIFPIKIVQDIEKKIPEMKYFRNFRVVNENCLFCSSRMFLAFPCRCFITTGSAFFFGAFSFTFAGFVAAFPVNCFTIGSAAFFLVAFCCFAVISFFAFGLATGPLLTILVYFSGWLFGVVSAAAGINKRDNKY